MSELLDRPVSFVVPEAIDDPHRVSGGNVYDQHVRDGLRGLGWEVRMVEVADAPRSLRAALSGLPPDALVLVDGLLAAREPETLVEQAGRLRMVVLAHMVASGRAALRSAQRVIATSDWTRTELVSRGFAEPHRVVVAHPGADPAPETIASPSGGRLLCAGVVAPHKGQDLLVRALAGLTAVDGWTCTFAGSLDAHPEFVAQVRRDVERAGLSERVAFSGVLGTTALASAYRRADLVVVPSRSESYGMVVGEALARGIPVVASDTGGLPEAMSGGRGGVLVPPEDPWALEIVLRHWLTSPDRRAELTSAALLAREAGRSWSTTTALIAATLHEVALGEPAVAR